MAYSCGIFRDESATLFDASVEKFDTVCRKLDLRASDRVLEIGSGWGGFAIHAAANYDCQVTTTTISHEQCALAGGRIAAAGLEHRISLLEQDYRELTGRFDKLVSIEMIEAVGHEYLDTFFRQCGALLAEDGSMLLQGIMMPERGHAQYLRGVDFIQRYIFPGGCLPSLSSILGSIGRTTDLRLAGAETWRRITQKRCGDGGERFSTSWRLCEALGYSEEFIRLWNYYLSYCEAAFEEGAISVLQLQFDKPRCRRSGIARSARTGLAWRRQNLNVRECKPDHGHSGFWNRGGRAWAGAGSHGAHGDPSPVRPSAERARYGWRRAAQP